jgi:hypothetical protein
MSNIRKKIFFNGNKNWDNNELQFARLLHEIDATQSVDWEQVAEQMDLLPLDILELIQRANEVFTGVKLDG